MLLGRVSQISPAFVTAAVTDLGARDAKLDTAILITPRFGFVRCHWLLLTMTFDTESRTHDPMLDKIVTHRSRRSSGQLLVMGIRARAVGVTDNTYLNHAGFGQRVDCLSEDLHRVRLNR